MIETRIGDIFANDGNCIIAHGCNAQGVMGSGFAKEIKTRYPGAFHEYYTQLSLMKSFEPFTTCLGRVFCWEVYGFNSRRLIIANAITQNDFGRDRSIQYVDYSAIAAAFIRIGAFARYEGIGLVKFPKIGCGLGNGDWNIVSKIIDDSLPDDILKQLWIKE